MKKGKIGQKVQKLLLSGLFFMVLLMGAGSMVSLYSMKQISADSSRSLGNTAAQDAKDALEDAAGDRLQAIAAEKAAVIEEKYKTITSYVNGMAALAEDIYANPQKYPDRDVALPVFDSRELAAQLIWSKQLDGRYEEQSGERLKLGNIQDLLVQYNGNDDMVSSTYVATVSGWMIQADYIPYSKFDAATGEQNFFEASERQWFQKAMDAAKGEVVHTDIIRDYHGGSDCIVFSQPIYKDGKIVAVAGLGSYLTTIRQAVLNTAVGEDGYAFLVNEKGQVMLSAKEDGDTASYSERAVDLRESENAQLAQIASHMVSGESGQAKLAIDGREVYLAYAPLSGLSWSFATVMEVDEAIAPAMNLHERILNHMDEVEEEQHKAIRRTLLYFVVVSVCAVLTVSALGTFFTRKLTAPIRRLTEEVAQLGGGNLDTRIQITTGDEVEELGTAFNRMVEQLQSYMKNLAQITAEKERIRTEIQVASRLQADMLPQSKGAFSGMEEIALYASMVPAKGVGGDFYDFFLLDEEHLVLIMADVSGKGIPAALFMVVSRTLLRSHVSSGEDLKQALADVNENLCENNKNGMFVTAWVGILSLTTGSVNFINAGHCRPLIQSSDGSCRYENAFGGFVLAGMEGSRYREAQLALGEGDTLFLYTDGVTEATSSGGELYGEERLKNYIGELGKKAPEELLHAVWADVSQFQSGAEQFDDITMLAVTYRGSGFKKKSGVPDIEYLEDYNAFVERVLAEKEISDASVKVIRMAVDELFTNICRYSNASEVRVEIKVSTEREIVIRFVDDGIFFNPLERQDPDVEEPLEARAIGGLGIYLVKKRMDSVAYEYLDGKNCLTIKKRDAVTKI